MNKRSGLSENDQNIVLQCMLMVLYGGIIDHFEFQTRLGISEEELQQVITRWQQSGHSSGDDTEILAVSNCFNEILNGVVISDDVLKKLYRLSQTELASVFDKWKSL